MQGQKFADRQEAGKELAVALAAYANRRDAIVLALPRGGVPVAFEVASALHLPLDVFIVRKLGVPGHKELAMGAIAMGGVQVLNEDVISEFKISAAELAEVNAVESEEMKRRELVYRGQRPVPPIKNKVVILVDDGIATGASMRAAIKALRQFKPDAIIVAVPVADKLMCEKFCLIADKVFCTLKPAVFQAVGAFYDNFTQITDLEVHALLEQSLGQSLHQSLNKERNS